MNPFVDCVRRYTRTWAVAQQRAARKHTRLRVEELESRDVPSAISLFETTDPSFAPAIPIANDTSAVELGVKFTVFQPGTVTAIQFYRGGPSDTGFDVHLWDTSGNLLGSGHINGTQGPGWLTVPLDQPVHLNQFGSYFASYYSAEGGYADNQNFFSNGDWVRGPLVANGDGPLGGEASGVEHNGYFHYGQGGGFPDSTYLASNYWVGPVFQPDPSNVPLPTITGLSQTTASTAGGGTLTIQGTNLLQDNQPFPTIYIGDQPATVPAGINGPNSITVNIPAHSAGTVDVRVITGDGETDITPADQLTYAAPTVPANAIALFETNDPSFAPAIPIANDTSPVELGVKFTSQVAGTVTAIEFYRGGTSGTGFDVHLWDASGNLLGSGHIAGNSAPGWQVVLLDQPVHLDANVTYVASYFAPNGGYADNYDFFTGFSWQRGPLSAWPSGVQAGGNGVYHYGQGGGFPDATYRDSNYWVGPVFQPDSGPEPTVSSLSFSSSPSSGGSVLTIHGSNFLSGSIGVFFGDASSLNFTVVDANTLAVQIPPHPSGTIDVRVITDGGESAVTANDLFTFTL